MQDGTALVFPAAFIFPGYDEDSPLNHMLTWYKLISVIRHNYYNELQDVIISECEYEKVYTAILFLTFPIVFDPDKPTNLAFTNITKKSARITWQDPKYHGVWGISNSRIILKNENSIIQNITTARVNEYEITDLVPFTTYEVSVAAGNSSLYHFPFGFGFGEAATTTFLTAHDKGKYDKKSTQYFGIHLRANIF
jgi:hypothetical protein